MNEYQRPDELEGFTRQFPMGCGNIYVTFNFDDGKLMEVFMRIGKAGGCQGNMAQGLGRVLSISLQDGDDPAKLGRTLLGMQCPGAPPGRIDDPERLCSCLDGIGRKLVEIGRLHAEGKVYIGGWRSVDDQEDTGIDKQEEKKP